MGSRGEEQKEDVPAPPESPGPNVTPLASPSPLPNLQLGHVCVLPASAERPPGVGPVIGIGTRSSPEMMSGPGLDSSAVAEAEVGTIVAKAGAAYGVIEVEKDIELKDAEEGSEVDAEREKEKEGDQTRSQSPRKRYR